MRYFEYLFLTFLTVSHSKQADLLTLRCVFFPYHLRANCLVFFAMTRLLRFDAISPNLPFCHEAMCPPLPAVKFNLRLLQRNPIISPSTRLPSSPLPRPLRRVRLRSVVVSMAEEAQAKPFAALFVCLGNFSYLLSSPLFFKYCRDLTLGLSLVREHLP